MMMRAMTISDKKQIIGEKGSGINSFLFLLIQISKIMMEVNYLYEVLIFLYERGYNKRESYFYIELTL